MGDRHNRKRTRHRPIRRQRLLCQQPDTNTASTTTTSSDQSSSPPYACSCWRPATRQQVSAKPLFYYPPSTQCSTNANPACTKYSIAKSPETTQSRTHRVFGGIESLDGDESTELCVPMLNVVLGLFGGIDYDDDDDGQ